jgi:hypothetical protein
MIAGHYATALVAYERDRTAPLWLFLLASMLLDFIMAALVLTGVESMRPVPVAGKPQLATFVIEMTYSHDVVPVVGWALAMAAIAFAVTRRRSTALWAAGLVAVHEVADLISGFPHFVLGPDTPRVGLGLYTSAPLLALAIELGLGLACVGWFCSRTNLSRGRRVGLYAVVTFGTLALLPAAL